MQYLSDDAKVLKKDQLFTVDNVKFDSYRNQPICHTKQLKTITTTLVTIPMVR